MCLGAVSAPAFSPSPGPSTWGISSGLLPCSLHAGRHVMHPYLVLILRSDVGSRASPLLFVDSCSCWPHRRLPKGRYLLIGVTKAARDIRENELQSRTPIEGNKGSTKEFIGKYLQHWDCGWAKTRKQARQFCPLWPVICVLGP